MAGSSSKQTQADLGQDAAVRSGQLAGLVTDSERQSPWCRCTRSVGRCQPAYYAHLCATRGRMMLSRTGGGGSSCGSDSGRGWGGPGSSGKESTVEWAEIHPNLENRMYYV